MHCGNVNRSVCVAESVRISHETWIIMTLLLYYSVPGRLGVVCAGKKLATPLILLVFFSQRV